MHPIKPVILCGGAGSRLWPVSRKTFPKQFVPLINEKSLFDQAIERVRHSSFLDPLVVAASEHQFLVDKALRQKEVTATVLLEPSGKNTCPAIFAATKHCIDQYEDSLLLVMPSDHHIPDVCSFRDMVKSGIPAAENGMLVVFGVPPEQVNTGFGYIEVGSSLTSDYSAVKKFIEKPDLEAAKMMFASGNFLWNSGIFLFKASSMLALADALEEEILTKVSLSLANAKQDRHFWQLEAKAWEEVKKISIDHAIVEKAESIACVTFSSKWSDLGDWNSLINLFPRDRSRNFRGSNTSQFDCKNTAMWSVSDRIHLVGLGLENIISVVTDDAVLLANANRTQDIRAVVEKLQLEGVPQATDNERDYRPWGWFEVLLEAPNYKIKRLHVYPEATLSLQSHNHRSEHWVVVEGTATVIREDNCFELRSNKSIYIEAGQKHRLANNGLEPLVVIEVQTGSYLGEDDIYRYEDIYNRQ